MIRRDPVNHANTSREFLLQEIAFIQELQRHRIQHQHSWITEEACPGGTCQNKLNLRQQLGGAYCDVVSLSTVPEGPEGIAIIKELMAIRMKLRRSTALMANVPYEFSLRGKWPKERYKVVCEIQM